MLRCAKWSFRLRIAAHATCRRPRNYQRSFTLSHSAARTLIVPEGQTQGVQRDAKEDSQDGLKRRFDTLVFHLNRHAPNWNRSWRYYEDLLAVAGPAEIPLELHQKVLRCCSPSPQEVRTANSRRLSVRNIPASPHLHENRFKTVIRNIRATGTVPDVEDFNFILLQFAAVGHYVGAMRILKEMEQMGVKPRNRTYGLCLQTIAHRLTLPCKKLEMPRLVQDLQSLSIRILGGLKGSGASVTSVNLDLLLRILKYSDRPDVFEKVLKQWYGIDLAYPDRLPLEVSEEVGDPDGLVDRLIPISTSTLTTIIDFLGYKKEVSKMVAAFEVLSSPPPTSSETTGSPAFEDDDDDFSSPAPPNSSRLSHALPNTSTFNTLIRHCAWNRSGDLARHYVLQALEWEKESSAQLRSNWLRDGKYEISQPFVRVNKHTFLPLLGLANREKKYTHLDWLIRRVRIARSMKKDELSFFAPYVQGTPVSIEPIGHVGNEPPNTALVRDTDLPKPAMESTFFTPSSVSSDSGTLDDHLNSGEDDFSLSSMPHFRSRTFDPKIHISILQNQLQQLEDLHDVIGSSMSRVSERIKERTERRISRGKDVYLPDKKKRGSVNLEHQEDSNPGDVVNTRLSETSPDVGKTTYKSDQSVSPDIGNSWHRSLHPGQL